MREVGEQPVGAGVVEAHRRAPAAVGGLLGVQVLEAGQVAPGEDQVHALLVLDVEVAHGLAARVVDPEAQRRFAAAAQLGVVDDDAQAVGGDREAAHGVGGVCGGHLGVLLRGVFAGLGSDRAARDRRAAEQQREPGRERSELGDRVHAHATPNLAVPPRGIRQECG